MTLGGPALPSRAWEAREPPEARGLARDGVRLLASSPDGDRDRAFADLPELLRAGDLLVVNESATIPASLPARAAAGELCLNLATRYGERLWLVEPRWGPALPGPVPLSSAERIDVAGLGGTVLDPYPGIPRLRFVRFDGDPTDVIARAGRPIRYGYLRGEYPLEAYQTIFGRVPGSAEMPSAGRPFTPRVLARLAAAGVSLAAVLLHTGVSSLEQGDRLDGGPPVFPEPFEVPAATARAVARTRAGGGRVIAVGTTVVRALESACDHGVVRDARGFTRVYLSPERPVQAVDGLLTGFHDAGSTHLALLASLADAAVVERSYRHARASGYLWHEFGDSQLLLPALPKLWTAA